MAYRLTNNAIDDIIAIFNEGVHCLGFDQAERYHTGMARVFQLLADNPELARERLEISPPVRVHPHGSHLIIYLVDQYRDILIVRVRHGHEDWNPQGST